MPHTTGAVFAVAVAALLTACGGGGLPVGSVVNSPGGGASSPPTQLVDVNVTVTIPAAKKRSGIRSQYVSANTQSLVIQLSSVNGNGVAGVNPTTIETDARAKNCSGNGGAVVCSGTASGSPGNDVFSVTTYSGRNATGSVLSVGTVQAKITGNGGHVQITNNLPLTLGGVIAALQLSVSPSSAKRGKPEKAAVTLEAFDATGAQIVGPSDYASPITLQIQGDTQNAFVLHAGGKSGISLAIVRPTSNITLSYDGNKQAAPVTLAATVAGSNVGQSANFDLRGKIPPPPVGTIYVLNLGANQGKSAVVTEYDGKARGNAAPVRTLSLNSKLYARSIAVDSSGNLYVGYLDNPIGYNTGTGQPDAGNEVAIYAPGASGSDEPTALLGSNASTSSNLYPIFMAIDPSQRLASYGATSVDGNDPTSKGAVLTYAADPSGTPPPEYAFNFGSPYLKYNNAGPTGLAIDSKNDFYVNGKLEAGFGVYDYGVFVAAAANIGSADAPTARTIPWDSKTELSSGQTTNVGVDSQGEIYVGNWIFSGSGSAQQCQARVNVFAAGYGSGSTDVPPIRLLSLDGVNSKGSVCNGNSLLSYFPTIALYGSSLFVADPLNEAVDAFASTGNGAVKPSLQIAGSATQLSAPVALVITSSGSATADSAYSSNSQ